jgi:glycosyltransferase involved in cell wall biosynthesis
VTGVDAGADAPLLFCSHAADRTGPPIYLLHFLRWLRAHHPEVDFELAFLSGGELEPDFRALEPARMSVYEGFPPTRYDDEERAFLLEHLDLADLWWAVRREQQLRRQMRQHAGCRVVHVNSAPSAELARLLPAGDRVLLSHVHDLEIGLTHRLAPPDREAFLRHARRLFAASEAVRTNLVERHGVERSLIALHHEMVDASSQPEVVRTPDAVAEGRRRRGLPTEGLLVGASGTLDWRKAPDLFLRAAWHLTRAPRAEPLTFVWIGGDADGADRASRMAAELGVDHLVRFVGVQADPVEWFALLDVFVLPSREDPFPLVCLEALSVGVPVVAFDTGGMPELLTQGCGLVSPYPDVDHLASRVDELLLHPDRRRELGDRGRELIAANHDVTVLAPRLWADIARWLP